MRYNPATDNAIKNERIQSELEAKFKSNAAVKSETIATVHEWGVDWAELERLHYATGRVTGRIDARFATCCNLSHAIEVAKAMGNFAEARRLGAQLVAKLY